MKNKLFILSLSIMLLPFMFILISCKESHIHNWSEGWSADAQTHWIKCNDCDEIKDAIEHTESEWIISNDSTCTSTGNKYKKCTICGIELETEIIEKKQHIITNWAELSPANCEQAQQLERHCTMCETKNETKYGNPATGHSTSDWIMNHDLGTIYKQCLTCFKTLEQDYIEYSITFVTYCNETIDKIDAKANSSIYSPTKVLEKQGYDFAGWYSDSSFNNEFVFSTMPIGGATLYAKWDLHEYQINYNLTYGENNENPQKFTVLNGEIELKNPTRNGYVFDGWYKDENHSQKIEKLLMPQYEDISIYPKWISIFEVEEGVITGLTTYGKTLKSVIIPEEIDCVEITEIGEYAFESNIELEEVEFSDNLRKINKYAFLACVSLKEITIPENLILIGEGAFANCSNVKEINYNAKSLTVNTNIFNLTGTVDLVVNIGEVENLPSGLFYDSNVKILNLGKTLKRIGNACFAESQVEIINGGDSVEYIHNYAFQLCEKLTTSPIQEGLKGIGDYAIAGCSKIKKIEFPTTLEYMGLGTLRGLLGLEEFIFKSSNLETSSTSGTFSNYGYGEKNADLTIYIDKDVTKIPYGFFSLCEAKTFYYDAENCTSSGLGEGFGVSAGTEVIVGENVKRIPDWFFNGNENVTSVIIGENVECFSSMFSDCLNLAYIEFNAIDYTFTGSYGHHAPFMNSGTNSNAEFSNVKIKIGDKVKKIEEFRWGMFRKITEIKLGKSLSVIDGMALENLYVEELYIPENLAFIKSHSSATYSVDKVVVDENNKVFSSKDSFGNELNLIYLKAQKETVLLGNNFTLPKDGSITTLKSYNYIVFDSLIIPSQIVMARPCLINAQTIYLEDNKLPEWISEYIYDSDFYIYSETQPTSTEYSYWHYGEDGKTIVLWKIQEE